MPQLWTDTIASHRAQVRQTVMDVAWRLAVQDGVLSVTMSQIAGTVGIGRATLYKYFPDVESILVARHEQQVERHLQMLSTARESAATPLGAMEAVLRGYAQICRHRAAHGNAELVNLFHADGHPEQAQPLLDLLEQAIADAADANAVRRDVAPIELARFVLNGLNAVAADSSPDQVDRLLMLTRSSLSVSDPG